MPTGDADRVLGAVSVLLGQGEVEAAEALCRVALELRGFNALLHSEISQAMLGAGRGEIATRLAERAAAIAPDDPVAVLCLAEVLAQQGETDRAIEALEAALRRGARVAPVHVLLVRLLIRRGEVAAAEAAMARALKMCPDDALLQALAGELLLAPLQ